MRLHLTVETRAAFALARRTGDAMLGARRASGGGRFLSGNSCGPAVQIEL
jgi:hypothetical protein